MAIKFEVTLELIEEIAECVHRCSWVSEGEIAAYMKSMITDSGDYEPEDWSEDGRGEIEKDNSVIDVK